MLMVERKKEILGLALSTVLRILVFEYFSEQVFEYLAAKAVKFIKNLFGIFMCRFDLF